MRISLPSNWGLDSGAGFVLVVDALVDEFTAVWEGATDDGKRSKNLKLFDMTANDL